MSSATAVSGPAPPPSDFNRLPLIAMLSANAISGAGNMMSRLAIPWFVLETTGSAVRTGITGAVEAIPLIIAGIFGGALVDRVGFRRMSVVSDFASGATVAIIPALHFTIGLEFWQLLVLVFAGALLDTPGQTARQSIIPELAEEAGVSLTTANGYFGAINRSTQLIGPLIAGVFIAFVGAAPLLWIDAVTFAVSAALMVIFVPTALSTEGEASESTSSYRSDLVQGFRWIAGNALIRTLVAMILLTNLVESPLLVVMTVYARDVFDSSIALGLLLGVFSVGAIGGSLLSGAIASRAPRRWILPSGFGAVCVLYAVLILEPPLTLLLVTSLAVGIAAGQMNPFLMTVFQERVPRQMRGRVFGLRSALVMSSTPIGILAGGALIETSGLRMTLGVQLVAMSAVVLWMVVSPTLRGLDSEKLALEVGERPARATQ